MASGSEHLRPHLHAYLVAHSSPPDALLRGLIAETAERFPDRVVFQIGPEQGTFMTMLAGIMGARQVVEVGTFTGYSSICLARGLAQCGVAGEGADLDHLAGAHEAGQHRHERALLRADLEDHPVREAGGGLRDQVAQQRVRRAGVGDQILVQVRAQVLGSGGHGVDVSARVR